MKTPYEKIFEICQSELPLTIPELQLLPNKWELLGDVLIIKLDSKLQAHWKNIAEIYSNVLNAKVVLRRFEKISGIYREPGVEQLWGVPGDTETMHKENKVIFNFDPLRIMFSSGNIDERVRISTMANKSDTVIDMFSGIGYFAIPIAVHSRPLRIYACELNPLAYDYLCKNIVLNNVQDIVKPILGDNREAIPAEIGDRIIMGYIKCDQSHLAAAFKILNPTGGIVHFHNVGFNDEVIELSMKMFQDSMIKSGYNKHFNAELASYYKIKSFGPKLLHVVLYIKMIQK